MDEVVKRVMPHSNEAEQAVIGSMLMDANAISVAGETITADDFYQKNYAELFKAMMELSAKGKSCDLVTVKAQLEEQGVSSEIVSLEFIKNILDMVTISANIKTIKLQKCNSQISGKNKIGEKEELMAGNRESSLWFEERKEHRGFT